MATYYVDTNLATGLNDGTSQANAWQTFAAMATSGTPSGGDLVHVRTADGGGNITDTMGSSITMTANTANTSIEVRFDDGTQWVTGGGGTFTLTNTGATAYDLIILEGWWFRSADGTERFRRYHNSTGTPQGYLTLTVGSIIEDTLLESSYSGTGNAPVTITPSATNDYSDAAEIKNSTFRITRNNAQGLIRPSSDGAKTKLVNVTFNCDLNVINGNFNPLLDMYSLGNPLMQIYGGRVTNESSNNILYGDSGGTSESGELNFYGFDPGTAKFGDQVTWSNAHNGRVTMEAYGNSFKALQHGTYGYSIAGWSGEGNHPTLNATLPDGSDTPWSLRCWNDQNGCFIRNPNTLFRTQKIYNAAAATTTIRVEMLIHNSITSPQKDEWYIDAWFVKDSDGSQGYVTSRTTGALASSTAGWSATTYGGNSYTKYKIELSTGVDVEQYSPILVNLISNRAAGASDQFYFVDPDFQLD